MSKRRKRFNRLRLERSDNLFEMLDVIDAEVERRKSKEVLDEFDKARVFALMMFYQEIMDELAKRG